MYVERECFENETQKIKLGSWWNFFDESFLALQGSVELNDVRRVRVGLK